MRQSLRPRMTAIAPSAAEAVQYAGGWLFDQAMAGWDVTVVTVDDGDPRPLDILGVRARTFDAVFAAPLLGRCLQADRAAERTFTTTTSGCAGWCSPPPRPAGPRSGSGARCGLRTSTAAVTRCRTG